MARYRQKTPEELAWNDLRRRITLQLDAEVRAVREFYLNELLTAAFNEFDKALDRGEVVVIETDVAGWVKGAMKEVMGSKIEQIEAVLSDAPQTG